MDPSTATVVSGAIAAIATIVAAVVSRYGLTGFSFRRRVFSGPVTAGEIEAINRSGVATPLDSKTEYEFYEFRLVQRGKFLKANGRIRMKVEGKTFVEGTIKGRGPYQAGHGHLVYTVKDSNRKIKWSGVCAINLPPVGEIRGYWITYGHPEFGPFGLGTIRMTQD